MSFFVAILYTAILGVLFEHSFHINPHAGPAQNAIRVSFFIRRDNFLICTFLVILFLTDWVCFHLLFGVSTPFRLDWLNAALLFMYLPATLCLGLTIVFSYERVDPGSHPKFCLTSGFYHSLALFAELAWLLYRARDLFPEARIPLSLVVILLAYLAFRGFVAYSYFNCYKNPKGLIRPEILGFSSVFIKPAFLLLISFSTPGLLQGA
jgi:hypothetical protein